MKKIVLFSVAALISLASCSKKTHPAATKSTREPDKTVPSTVSKDKDPEPATITTDAPPVTTTEPAPAAAMFTAPMIVIDESGKIITPADKLPEDIAGKVDYKKISHAFSLEQRKNLIYRFKMVPPRVLFVPANLASKSARGTYVVYKKKFWYWKKDDGLFHLDETYYQ